MADSIRQAPDVIRGSSIGSYQYRPMTDTPQDIQAPRPGGGTYGFGDLTRQQPNTEGNIMLDIPSAMLGAAEDLGIGIGEFIYSVGEEYDDDSSRALGTEIKYRLEEAKAHGIENVGAAIVGQPFSEHPFRKTVRLGAGAIPSVALAFLGGGIGANALVRAGWSAQMAGTVGFLAATAPLGAVEAGHFYREGINAGKSHGELFANSLYLGLGTSILEVAVPLTNWMGGGTLGRRIVRTSLQEGGEEVLQQFLTNSFKMHGWKGTKNVYEDLMDGVAESFVGGLLGGAFGGTFSPTQWKPRTKMDILDEKFVRLKALGYRQPDGKALTRKYVGELIDSAQGAAQDATWSQGMIKKMIDTKALIGDEKSTLHARNEKPVFGEVLVGPGHDGNNEIKATEESSNVKTYGVLVGRALDSGLKLSKEEIATLSKQDQERRMAVQEAWNMMSMKKGAKPIGWHELPTPFQNHILDTASLEDPVALWMQIDDLYQKPIIWFMDGDPTSPRARVFFGPLNSYSKHNWRSSDWSKNEKPNVSPFAWIEDFTTYMSFMGLDPTNLVLRANDYKTANAAFKTILNHWSEKALGRPIVTSMATTMTNVNDPDMGPDQIRVDVVTEQVNAAVDRVIAELDIKSKGKAEPVGESISDYEADQMMYNDTAWGDYDTYIEKTRALLDKTWNAITKKYKSFSKRNAKIMEAVRTQGWAEIVGLDIGVGEKMHAALIEIGTLFRNPHAEISQVVYIKMINGTNVIVGHSSSTLNNPLRMHVNLKEISHKIKSLKADGFMIIHNHPSGNPTFSQTDLVGHLVTEKVIKGKVKYLGTVATDGDSYNYIKPGDSVSNAVRYTLNPGAARRIGVDFSHKYEQEKQIDFTTGQTVYKPSMKFSDVINFSRQNLLSGAAQVILLNSSMRVISIEYVAGEPNSLSIANTITRLIKASNATQYVLLHQGKVSEELFNKLPAGVIEVGEVLGRDSYEFIGDNAERWNSVDAKARYDPWDREKGPDQIAFEEEYMYNRPDLWTGVQSRVVDKLEDVQPGSKALGIIKREDVRAAKNLDMAGVEHALLRNPRKTKFTRAEVLKVIADNGVNYQITKHTAEDMENSMGYMMVPRRRNFGIDRGDSSVLYELTHYRFKLDTEMWAKLGDFIPVGRYQDGIFGAHVSDDAVNVFGWIRTATRFYKGNVPLSRDLYEMYKARGDEGLSKILSVEEMQNISPTNGDPIARADYKRLPSWARNQFTEFALKNAMAIAQEDGFDGLIVSNGEQQRHWNGKQRYVEHFKATPSEVDIEAHIVISVDEYMQLRYNVEMRDLRAVTKGYKGIVAVETRGKDGVITGYNLRKRFMVPSVEIDARERMTLEEESGFASNDNPRYRKFRMRQLMAEVAELEKIKQNRGQWDTLSISEQEEINEDLKERTEALEGIQLVELTADPNVGMQRAEFAYTDIESEVDIDQFNHNAIEAYSNLSYRFKNNIPMQHETFDPVLGIKMVDSSDMLKQSMGLKVTKQIQNSGNHLSMHVGGEVGGGLYEKYYDTSIVSTLQKMLKPYGQTEEVSSPQFQFAATGNQKGTGFLFKKGVNYKNHPLESTHDSEPIPVFDRTDMTAIHANFNEYARTEAMWKKTGKVASDEVTKLYTKIDKQDYDASEYEQIKSDIAALEVKGRVADLQRRKARSKMERLVKYDQKEEYRARWKVEWHESELMSLRSEYYKLRNSSALQDKAMLKLLEDKMREHLKLIDELNKFQEDMMGERVDQEENRPQLSVLGKESQGAYFYEDRHFELMTEDSVELDNGVLREVISIQQGNRVKFNIQLDTNRGYGGNIIGRVRVDGEGLGPWTLGTRAWRRVLHRVVLERPQIDFFVAERNGEERTWDMRYYKDRIKVDEEIVDPAEEEVLLDGRAHLMSQPLGIQNQVIVNLRKKVQDIYDAQRKEFNVGDDEILDEYEKYFGSVANNVDLALGIIRLNEGIDPEPIGGDLLTEHRGVISDEILDLLEESSMPPVTIARIVAELRGAIDTQDTQLQSDIESHITNALASDGVVGRHEQRVGQATVEQQDIGASKKMVEKSYTDSRVLLSKVGKRLKQFERQEKEWTGFYNKMKNREGPRGLQYRKLINQTKVKIIRESKTFKELQKHVERERKARRADVRSEAVILNVLNEVPITDTQTGQKTMLPVGPYQIRREVNGPYVDLAGNNIHFNVKQSDLNKWADSDVKFLAKDTKNQVIALNSRDMAVTPLGGSTIAEFPGVSRSATRYSWHLRMFLKISQFLNPSNSDEDVIKSLKKYFGNEVNMWIQPGPGQQETIQAVVQEALDERNFSGLAEMVGRMSEDIIIQAVDEYVGASYPHLNVDERREKTRRFLVYMNYMAEEVIAKDGSMTDYYYSNKGYSHYWNAGKIDGRPHAERDFNVDRMAEFYEFMTGNEPDDATLASWMTKRPEGAFWNMAPYKIQNIILWSKSNVEDPLFFRQIDDKIMDRANNVANRLDGFTHRFWRRDPSRQPESGGAKDILGSQRIPKKDYYTYAEYEAAVQDDEEGVGLQSVSNYASSMRNYARESLVRIKQKETINKLHHARDPKTGLPLVSFQNDKAVESIMLANTEMTQIENFLTKMGYQQLKNAEGLIIWDRGAYYRPWVRADVANVLDQFYDKRKTGDLMQGWNKVNGFIKRVIMSSPYQFMMQIVSSPALWYSKLGFVGGSKMVWKQAIEPILPWNVAMGTVDQFKNRNKPFYNIEKNNYDYEKLELFVKHGLKSFNIELMLNSLYDHKVMDDHPLIRPKFDNLWETVKGKFGLDNYAFSNYVARNMYEFTNIMYEQLKEQGLDTEQAAREAVKFSSDTSGMLNRNIYGDEGGVLMSLLFARDFTMSFGRQVSGASFNFWGDTAHGYKVGAMHTTNSILHGEADTATMNRLGPYYLAHLSRIFAVNIVLGSLFQMALWHMRPPEDREEKDKYMFLNDDPGKLVMLKAPYPEVKDGKVVWIWKDEDGSDIYYDPLVWRELNQFINFFSRGPGEFIKGKLNYGVSQAYEQFSNSDFKGDVITGKMGQIPFRTWLADRAGHATKGALPVFLREQPRGLPTWPSLFGLPVKRGVNYGPGGSPTKAQALFQAMGRQRYRADKARQKMKDQTHEGLLKMVRSREITPQQFKNEMIYRKLRYGTLMKKNKTKIMKELLYEQNLTKK